jgi:hypothetical protein
MSVSAPDVRQHPHFSHLFQVGVLLARSQSRRYPKATRAEAERELTRYHDQGLNLEKYGKEPKVAKKTRAHAEPRTYSGQGILFAVIDDREFMASGRQSTIDVIANAIEAALDAGHETSDEIARYLTTSAFQHVTDKRVRFNSVLKAGDAVGAQILRKLYNSYNELVTMASEIQDPKEKASMLAEATGFAEAIQIVISPFTCEDPADPRLVNWDEVDRITAAFEKEQRAVIRERKGNPQ